MSSEAKENPSRRVWNFVGYLCTFAASALLFVVATAWFLHAHRTEIVTRTIADYVAPYQLSLGSIDIDRTGRVHLDSVALTDPADASTRLELGHADWDWDTRSLISARYGTFDLQSPTIRIGPKTFATWMERAATSPDPTPDTTPPPLIETLALSLQKVGISSGKFDFQADGYPAVTFDFEYLGHEIGIDSGRLSADPQKLQIRNFEAVFAAPDSPPTTVRFSGLDLEFHAEREPSLLDISTADFTGLELQITPAILTYAPLWSTPPTGPPTPPSSPIFAQLILDHLKLPNIRLSVSGFDGTTPSLPDLESDTDLAVENLAVDLERGTFSIGRQTIDSRDLDLRFPTGPGHFQFQNLTASAGNITFTGATVDSITLTGADADLTAIFLDRLTSASTADSPSTPATSPDPPAPPLEIAIKRIEIPDAKIAASFIPDVPETTFTLDATLTGWTTGDYLPDADQVFLVSDLTMGTGPGSPPLAKIGHIALHINPATFVSSHRIASLQVISPHFHLTPQNFPKAWTSPRSEGNPARIPEQSQQVPLQSQPPSWHGFTIADLAVEDGIFDIKERTLRGVPTVHLNFEASTQINGGTPTYTIPLTDITSTIESFQKAPFQTTRALTFILNADDLWENHTFTEVDFDGISGVMAQDLLDAIFNMFEGTGPADPPTPIPPPDPPDTGGESPGPAGPKPETGEVPPHEKPWKIGRLRVRNSTVTLRGVAPGLPPVTVGIKADLEGVPISPDAFLGDLRDHRVEIDKIKIPSYYNTLVNVAVLENIWVDFTLDGIANQRIDNVIVGSPTVFVGEHLFWYIDYYRKFLDESAAAEETPAPAPPPTEVQSDPASAPDPTGNSEPEPGAEEEPAAGPKIPNEISDFPDPPGWTVTRLQALNGKLIVAPKGTPVPGFPYPFPFSADTTLESGELHSEFTVTNGTYELEDIKLKLTDLHGGVEFNLPFKQVNNNLTETLVAKEMRFHQMESENPWITVTYDTYGIYAKFGAEMYGGYLKGAFNIYLDEQYTWDSWVTGTAIDTEPLTSALTPEYFKMDGPIDFSVIATGNASELYQADGTLEGNDPGKMTIEALNDAISAIPGDWIEVEKRITEIGLETLRDFDYDSVKGSFRLFGREGKIDLDLRGPNGSRVFKIRIHDHRRPALDPDLLEIEKPNDKPRQAPVAPDPIP